MWLFCSLIQMTATKITTELEKYAWIYVKLHKSIKCEIKRKNENKVDLWCLTGSNLIHGLVFMWIFFLFVCSRCLRQMDMWEIKWKMVQHHKLKIKCTFIKQMMKIYVFIFIAFEFKNLEYQFPSKHKSQFRLCIFMTEMFFF